MKDYEKYLNPETGAKLIEILDGNKLVAKVNITFKKNHQLFKFKLIFG